jgi:hypothetical protein
VAPYGSTTPLASEKEPPHRPPASVTRPNDPIHAFRGAGRRGSLSSVRFLAVVGLLVLFSLLGVLASSSCILATRDLPDGSDVGAAPSATGSDADIDCGCCAETVLPLLPFCSGKVAFAVPLGDCPEPCVGAFAYVLCQGTCYTACACTLPEEYSLIDGGFVFGDDAANDASAEASDEIGDAEETQDASDHGKDASVTDRGPDRGVADTAVADAGLIDP